MPKTLNSSRLKPSLPELRVSVVSNLVLRWYFENSLFSFFRWMLVARNPAPFTWPRLLELRFDERRHFFRTPMHPSKKTSKPTQKMNLCQNLLIPGRSFWVWEATLEIEHKIFTQRYNLLPPIVRLSVLPSSTKPHPLIYSNNPVSLIVASKYSVYPLFTILGEIFLISL